MSFEVKGKAAARGRYATDAKRTVEIDAEIGERVAPGFMPGKEGSDALVYSVGTAQTGIPAYAIAQAIATGTCVSFTELVSACKALGNLDKLAREVEKQTPKAPASPAK